VEGPQLITIEILVIFLEGIQMAAILGGKITWVFGCLGKVSKG